MQRGQLRRVLIDCRQVVEADLKDSDRAKLGLVIQKLERMGLNLAEFTVCVVATHPTIKERYQRQRSQTVYGLLLAETVEEGELMLGVEPDTLEESPR